jgi:uncharacterized protein (DUF2141 family)
MIVNAVDKRQKIQNTACFAAAILAANFWAAAVAEAEPRAELTIRVSNGREARGIIHVDICTAATFLKTCTVSGSAPALVGTTIIVIKGLKPGTYGAQIFHDKNGNGKVDRGLFGIPKEGVGFSNDAPIRFAPPTFSDAAFTYGGGAETINIHLRYF